VLIQLFLLPVTVAVMVLRLGFGVIRVIRVRRLVVFGLGVVVGLLAAPTTGAELRERIRRELEARKAPSDDELARRVRTELAQSPRTWHLPQPEVQVSAGIAVLRGQVPHEEARADLERAARSVRGVEDVESHLQVATA
jgi:hypothetical protein